MVCQAAGLDYFDLTCGIDRRAHLVSVTEVETAIESDRGWFAAICGLRVVASSMAAPHGARCLDCHRAFTALAPSRRRWPWGRS